jgi:DNA-binding NtrC family response regulator
MERFAGNLAAILIVDDDADVRLAAKLALAAHAGRIEAVANPGEMTALLSTGAFDCILLDMNFALGEHNGRAGLDTLKLIHDCDPAIGVILMTSFGAVSLAVEGLKRGAYDFLLKPWRNEALVAAVLAAGEHTREERRGVPLDIQERDAIRKALTQHAGNIAQAASTLGLSRPALYRRMAKHGL